MYDFEKWEGKVLPPTSFAHVVLQTRNLQRMKDFYVTFLGGRVVHADETMAFITYDDEHHRVALAQIPDISLKVKASCGLHHIAYAYPTLSDLLLAYKHRQKAGFTPWWSVNHGPSTSIYYEDPDGNYIETQADNFSDNNETDVFMKSKYFAVNPIGTDVDPEHLIKRLQNGATEEELKKRVEIGPRTDVPEPN